MCGFAKAVERAACGNAAVLAHQVLSNLFGKVIPVHILTTLCVCALELCQNLHLSIHVCLYTWNYICQFRGSSK